MQSDKDMAFKQEGETKNNYSKSIMKLLPIPSLLRTLQVEQDN